jgi:hypothetical protein
MDLMGIVPSRPWYRRPQLWVGLGAVIAVTLIALWRLV